jgi:hypothetical protein
MHKTQITTKAAKERFVMCSETDQYGSVFFVDQATCVVSHLSIPAYPSVSALELATRAEFNAVAIAGGPSVQSQFRDLLATALVEPHGELDRDVAIAVAGLGLLRLHNCESLAVIDRDGHYDYTPIADGEDALMNLQIFGRPVASSMKPWQALTVCTTLRSCLDWRHTHRLPRGRACLAEDAAALDALDLDREAITRAREHEDFVQFALRGAVRDSSFGGRYLIYVSSMDQAKALQAEFAASRITDQVEIKATVEAGILDVRRPTAAGGAAANPTYIAPTRPAILRERRLERDRLRAKERRAAQGRGHISSA